MRTPIGRISWVSVVLVVLVFATIAAGFIVPGRTGAIILVVGLVALGAGVYFEVALGTVGMWRNRRFPYVERERGRD